MGNTTSVFRTEKKYPLSLISAKCLEHQLKTALPLDPFCGQGQAYPVRSLYFDTVDDTDFYEKDAGLENRKKIRLRCYGPGTAIKMEVKQKRGSAQRKTSMPVTPEEAAELIRGNYDCLWRAGTPFAQGLYTLMREKCYIPRCVVEYQRLAFAVPTNDTRITLDSRLASNEGNFDILCEALPLYPIARGGVTLEVKYNHFLLAYVQQLLAPFQLTETASSKYCKARYYGLGGTTL